MIHEDNRWRQNAIFWCALHQPGAFSVQEYFCAVGNGTGGCPAGAQRHGALCLYEHVIGPPLKWLQGRGSRSLPSTRIQYLSKLLNICGHRCIPSLCSALLHHQHRYQQFDTPDLTGDLKSRLLPRDRLTRPVQRCLPQITREFP